MKITNSWWLRRTLETEHEELWNSYYSLISKNGFCLILKHRPVNVQVVFIIRTSEKNFTVNNYYNHEIKKFSCKNAAEVIKKLYELKSETILK